MPGITSSLHPQQPPLRHEGPSSPPHYVPTQPALHQQSNIKRGESEEEAPESNPCGETRGLSVGPDTKATPLQLSGIIGLQAVLIPEIPGQESAVDADLLEFASGVADFDLASIGESRAVQEVLEMVAADESNASQTDRITARILSWWIGYEDVDVLSLTDEDNPDNWVAPFIMYFLQTYPLTWGKCPSVGVREYYGCVRRYYQRASVATASHNIRWFLEEET